MKYVTLFAGLCALVAVVVWAYNMNYQTRQVFDRLDALRAEITAEGEAIQVLRVEWAWLNNPERLKRMVAAYGKDLDLTYLQGEHFSRIDSVPFPAPPDPEPIDPAPIDQAPAPEDLLLAAGLAHAPSEASPFPPPPVFPFPVPRPQGSAAALDTRRAER